MITTSMTVGKEVTTVLQGKEATEERENAVSAIHNKDNETKLFEAIMSVADLSDRMQDDNRKICLVISDGEDFSVGTSTNAEAQKALRERNIPVYAMGVKDTVKENLNAFGVVARGLGGDLIVFGATEASSALEKFQKAWEATWVIHAKGKNNIVNYQMNDVMVKRVSTGISRTKGVMVDRYAADQEAPAFEKVEKSGDTMLNVTFSEAVQNAENAVSWKVGFQGENLFISSAVYLDEAHQSVQLAFGKALYEGEYEVAAPGVTDISMEKNAVTETKRIHLSGNPVPEETHCAYRSTAGNH